MAFMNNVWNINKTRQSAQGLGIKDLVTFWEIYL